MGADLAQLQGNHPRRQACFQKRTDQPQQRRKYLLQLLMLVSGNLPDVVFQGEGQQAAGQFDQLQIELFGMACRVFQQFGQHRLIAVQRIEQPKQRDIGHSEVGHSLVAFAAHPHQAHALGGQLSLQIVQLLQQSAVGRQAEQWRHITRVQGPVALALPNQARDRASQVVAVLIAIQAQAQLVFEHPYRLRLVTVKVLDRTPGLSIPRRPISPLPVQQAVAAIGLFQRQSKQYYSLLFRIPYQPPQLQCRR
ncbi:hypothetical protein D3C85_1153410 [compost metagenome]